MSTEMITLAVQTADVGSLPLVTDIQYLEPFTSQSLNRKFCGVVRAGVFRGFSCRPAEGLALEIAHDTNQTGEAVPYGVALVERDDYLLTVRQQHTVLVELTAGQTSYVVVEAFFQHGVRTSQVDANSSIEAASIKVLTQAQVQSHHVILCVVTIPSGATTLTMSNLNFDERKAGGYDLDSHLADVHPHKQYILNNADSSVSANVTFKDNFKLKLGNSGDLSLFHNGSSSYVDNITGSLYLRENVAGGSLFVQAKNSAGTLVNGVALVGGANPYVQLFFGGSVKLATDAEGVSVTGKIKSTGEIYENGQRVFSPNNRNISDSVSGTSTTIYASQKSVKTAFDRAVSAENTAKSYADGIYTKLLGDAPQEALDTLTELAQQLNDDANALSAINNTLATKADKAIAIGVTGALTGGGTLGANFTIGVKTATTSQAGVVQLSSSVSSTSTAYAATAYAVKQAYDLAASKLDANEKAVDSNLLDGIDSTQFLRSDVADVKTAGNLVFNDNVRLALGTSSDASIYHSGSHAYLDNNTGTIAIRAMTAGNRVSLQAKGTTGAIYDAVNAKSSDENVYGELLYNGLSKLSAVSGGASVAGNLYATENIYERGQRVYSPNNKPTAGDVGALPITGGALLGSASVAGSLSVYTITGVLNHRLENVDSVATYRVDNAGGWRLYMDGKVIMHANPSGNVNIQSGELYEKSQRVYSPNNKPTADALGVMSATATSIPDGTDLFEYFKTAEGGDYKSGSAVTNGFNAWADYKVINHGGVYRTVFAMSAVGRSYQMTISGTTNTGWVPLYSERFKPTWVDVGGEGYFTKDASGFIVPAQWLRSFNPDRGILPALSGQGSTAVSYVGNSTWWFKEAWVNTYRGGSLNVTGTMETASNTALKQTISGASATLASMINVNDGDTRYINWGGGLNILSFIKTAVDGSGNAATVNVHGRLTEKGQRVYSPNNKPTADALGVLPTGSKSLNTSTDWDTLDTTNFYNVYKGSSVVFTNAPPGADFGTLSVVGGGDSGFVTQVFTRRTYNTQWIRTRTDSGGGGGWSSWSRIYSEAFKPTWADVGGNAYFTPNAVNYNSATNNINTKDIYAQLNDTYKIGTSTYMFKEAWVSTYRGGSAELDGYVKAKSVIMSEGTQGGLARLVGQNDIGYIQAGNSDTAAAQKMRITGVGGTDLDYLNISTKSGVHPTINGDKIFYEGNRPKHGCSLGDLGIVDSDFTGKTLPTALDLIAAKVTDDLRDADSNAVVWFDVSNSSHPILTALLPTDFPVVEIHLRGNYCYAMCRHRGSNSSLWHTTRQIGFSGGSTWQAFSTKLYVDTYFLKLTGGTVAGDFNVDNARMRVYNSTGAVNHLFENGISNATYRVDNTGGWRLFMGGAGGIGAAVSVANNGDTNIAGALSVKGDITSLGNVTGYSDKRIKTDIQVITNAVERVLALSGVTYQRTDVKTSRQTGLIAQDVQAVLPEAVVENEDGMLSVAYGNMAGLLVQAIKEQQAQIYSLVEEINRLKA